MTKLLRRVIGRAPRASGRTAAAAWTAALAVAGAVLLAGCSEPPHAAAPFANTDVTGASYGRDFRLTDHTGTPRTLADYRGKVVTLFFGYTQCPDVCPTSLATMAEVARRLGPDAEKLQVLFVTVDPERDTQELLAQYVPSFNPSFVGLRADPQTTAALAKEFKVFFQKQGEGEGYTVDHSAGTYVFDPQGRLRLYVKHGADPAQIVADLKRLLAGE